MPGFVFHPNKDVNSYDMQSQPLQNFVEAFRACSSMPECKAFNTKNWIKFWAPQAVTQTDVTYSGPCDGVYVRSGAGEKWKKAISFSSSSYSMHRTHACAV